MKWICVIVLLLHKLHESVLFYSLQYTFPSSRTINESTKLLPHCRMKIQIYVVAAAIIQIISSKTAVFFFSKWILTGEIFSYHAFRLPFDIERESKIEINSPKFISLQSTPIKFILHQSARHCHYYIFFPRMYKKQINWITKVYFFFLHVEKKNYIKKNTMQMRK